jgi:hypothetical protein
MRPQWRRQQTWHLETELGQYLISTETENNEPDAGKKIWEVTFFPKREKYSRRIPHGFSEDLGRKLTVEEAKQVALRHCRRQAEEA